MAGSAGLYALTLVALVAEAQLAAAKETQASVVVQQGDTQTELLQKSDRVAELEVSLRGSHLAEVHSLEALQQE